MLLSFPFRHAMKHVRENEVTGRDRFGNYRIDPDLYCCAAVWAPRSDPDPGRVGPHRSVQADPIASNEGVPQRHRCPPPSQESIASMCCTVRAVRVGKSVSTPDTIASHTVLPSDGADTQKISVQHAALSGTMYCSFNGGGGAETAILRQVDQFAW